GNRLTLNGSETLTFHLKNGISAASNILIGTKWELTSPTYTGLEKAPVLSFSNNRLNASVGLNSIFGNYTTETQKITIKSLASTRMAGPNPVMEAESNYIKALQSVRSFDVSADGQRLTLNGDQKLIFRSTDSHKNVLTGTEWTLTSPIYNGLEKIPFLKFSDN